jgi:uncharacterized membrane protein
VDQPGRGWTDEQVEQILGNLLRAGVLVAAAVVAAGGGMYLGQYGAAPVDYRTFRGVEQKLRSPRGILADALALHSRGVIQLGLLLLVATPVARVIFSVYAFARQRDFTYVILTLIVLAVLLYGLFVEHTS